MIILRLSGSKCFLYCQHLETSVNITIITINPINRPVITQNVIELSAGLARLLFRSSSTAVAT